jgi:hypothetical protein
MSKGKRRKLAVLRSGNYRTAGANDLKGRTIEIKYNTKAITKYVYNEYAFWDFDS